MPDCDQDDLPDAVMARPGGQNMLKQLALGLVGRWYWIALGLVLGFLGGIYFLAKTPNQYTATTSLLIKQQTATVMSRDQVDAIDVRSQEGLNTITALIQGKDLLEKLASREEIRKLPGLIPHPVDLTPAWLRNPAAKAVAAGDPRRPAVPSAAVLGGMIRGWLGVSIRRGTRLLCISITHPEPQIAKALADAVACEYLAEIANASTQGRKNSISVLETQSQEARTRLREAGSTLAILARAIEVCKALDAKEAEVAALQRRYLPKHPRMVTALAELMQQKAQFIHEFEVAHETSQDASPPQAPHWELPDARTHPEEYLRAARQQLLAHVGVLQSEIQSSTAVFNSMLTRIEESSVNQQAEEFNAEMSELASVPTSPSSPVPNKILAAGIMNGLVAGLLLAILLIRLDNKYHTVAQIASETGIPVLGAIAEISLHRLAVAEKQYRKRHPGAPLSEPHESGDERLVIHSGTFTTSYAEMYRSLRTSVARLGDASQRKITLFSSALPGEGKTLTSANFAAAAARQGRKTLLIDLDLRKPSIHAVFGLPRDSAQCGITECLANLASFEEVITHLREHDNLDLILAGKHAPNPGELLESGLLKSILAQACQDYDVVVLDSAPFLVVSDTRIIAPFAHNVCLVAKAEYVPKGALRHALEILEADNIRLSGIVFNGYKERRYLMGQNYSYGYYRSARYGRYDYAAYDNYGEA